MQNHPKYCISCGAPLHSHRAIRCSDCWKRDRKQLAVRGPAHPSWKGGKQKAANGYIEVWNGWDRKRTLEHRLIWEQTHNKKLPKGWIVHHLNGIKDDNRSENLVALPRNKHSVWTLVELAQKRIRELEQLHLHLS